MKRKDLIKFLQNGAFIGDIEKNKIWFATIERSSKIKTNNFFFYLDNFYLNKKNKFLEAKKIHCSTIEDFYDILSKISSLKPKIKWINLERNFYEEQFFSLKKEISQKTLKKGVPYSYLRGSGKINDKNKVYLIQNIIKNRTHPSSYLYGYWNKNEGMLGTTPELLFIQNEQKIFTSALAGTFFDTQKSAYILENHKLRNEHNYVIEGLKDCLSCYGEISIGKTDILTLPKLSHLKTNIEIDLNHMPFNFQAFLNSIHPSAALGTLPKSTHFNWLNLFENNKYQRGYFASPFGIVSNANHSLFICTIRGVQWKNNTVKICAGGGVIQESKIQEEWHEIIQKIDSIRSNIMI